MYGFLFSVKIASIFFAEDYSLLPEVWTFILTFLLPLDLFSLSSCSKRFYYLVHQNEKYKRRLEDSNRLVNFKKMDSTITCELQDFLMRVHFKCPNFLGEQIFFYLKKKLFLMLLKKCYHFKFIATSFFATEMIIIPHVYVVGCFLVRMQNFFYIMRNKFIFSSDEFSSSPKRYSIHHVFLVLLFVFVQKKLFLNHFSFLNFI